MLQSTHVTKMFDSIKNLNADDYEVKSVPLNDIFIDQADNTRNLDNKGYSEESIEGLANTIIAANGVHTPIWIVAVASSKATDFKKYILFSGYRRYLASKKATELTGDPKYVAGILAKIFPEGTDLKAIKALQVIENIREDIGIVETGRRIFETIGDDETQLVPYAKAVNIPVKEARAAYRLVKNFPDDVVEMVQNEEISKSNATLLASGEFQVGADDITRLAKVAAKVSYSAFKKILEDLGTSSSKKQTKKEAPSVKVISSSEASKSLIPFLDKKLQEYNQLPSVEDADEEHKAEIQQLTEPQFSKLDLDKAVIAAIKNVVGASDDVDGILAEYEKEVKLQKQLEEVEKEEKKKEKARASFIAKSATKINKMLDEFKDEDAGERKYANTNEALTAMYKGWSELSQADIEELGFDFSVDERKKIINEVGQLWMKKKKEKKEKKNKKNKKNQTIQPSPVSVAPTDVQINL